MVLFHFNTVSLSVSTCASCSLHNSPKACSWCLLSMRYQEQSGKERRRSCSPVLLQSWSGRWWRTMACYAGPCCLLSECQSQSLSAVALPGHTSSLVGDFPSLPVPVSFHHVHLGSFVKGRLLYACFAFKIICLFYSMKIIECNKIMCPPKHFICYSWEGGGGSSFFLFSFFFRFKLLFILCVWMK